MAPGNFGLTIALDTSWTKLTGAKVIAFQETVVAQIGWKIMQI